MTVSRPSRIAVAVIAPLALLAAGCGGDADGSDDAATDPASSSSSEPTATTTAPTATPSTSAPTEPTTTSAPAGVDHVVDGVWHQADGDAVRLPAQARDRDYHAAVLWDGQLVATRWDGEVHSYADVIAPDGRLVDTFRTTAPVVVNEAGTTIAWVDTDGDVMTAWEGDAVKMGEVDLAAPGETIGYSAAAVVGGPSCYEVDGGCIVFVNSGVGDPRQFDSHGIDDLGYPYVMEFGDVSADHLVTFVESVSDDGSCGGLVDGTQRDIRPEWRTCDHEPAQVAPDGKHVIGLPSYYDGLGITEISVLDARDGSVTGRFAPEGGFIAQWAWSSDGHVVLDAYDGARWHLFTLTPDGALAEIGEPVERADTDSPFVLIQH